MSSDTLPAPSRLLLVDDDPLYLRALVQMLRDEGYELALARSGEQALELLSATSFDCVVLDRIMPGLGGAATCRAIRAESTIATLPILMLTASEEREAILEGLDAGVDDYVTKSTDVDVMRARIRAQLRRKRGEDERRRIRDALHAREVEVARGSAAIEARAAVEADSAPPTRPSLLMPPRRLRVLLVDDHPVNLAVARRLLERLGHEVDIARDGKEAVDATATVVFDVVLMDVQMPILDGLDATRSIRAREKRTRAARLPIIALTANAMKTDREACLEAGMDDHLAKPVSPDALRDMLARHARVRAGFGVDAGPNTLRRVTSEIELAPAFALDAALSRVNGDRDLLREIAEILLDDGPRQIEELGRAASGGDVEAARRSAHSLKSAVATAGGIGASSALGELERAEEASLSRAYAVTRRAWDRFADELRAWLLAG